MVMLRRTCVWLICCCLPLVMGAYKRVCYYRGWQSGGLEPENIDASLCTHVIWAFATLDATGTHLQADSAHDTHQYIPFTDLKKQNPQLKVMLAVGGWEMGSSLFIKAVQSEANMRLFAHNAVTFLRQHNFDGLDIDWEYPGERGSGDDDYYNFASWIEIIHTTFAQERQVGADRLLLSLAVSPTEDRTATSYNTSVIGRYADFINLMMYDFHGQWEDTVNVHSALHSTDGANVDRLITNWASQGVPRDKLIVGVPLYGRMFRLSDPHNTSVGAGFTTGGDMPYYQICKLVQQGAIEHILPTERVPYIVVNNDMWVGYDNPQSINEKARYVVDHHYGGVMVWALGLDDVRGVCGAGPYPLMRALDAGLHGRTNTIVIG